jgi:hypothetical protein
MSNLFPEVYGGSPAGKPYNPLTGYFDPNTPKVAAPAPTPGPPPVDPNEAARIAAKGATDAARIAAEQRQREIDAENQRRKDATEGAIKAAFDQYGLSSLFPVVKEYAQQGLTEDEIYLKLRATAEYKNRFPAMETLAQKGRAISEAAYVDYERKAAQLEQQYGYPKGMVAGQITTLLVGDVSLNELNDRMVLSAADSITAPQDLKQQIKDYYNVDPDTALKAYYLDPEVALPILQKQSAAARIGVQATRQGVAGIDRTLAEELQAIGVSEAAAVKGFGTVAAEQAFTAGRGETATNPELTRGVFGNAEAAKKTERIASSRTGAFQSGGGFTETKQGVTGLGAASS